MIGGRFLQFLDRDKLCDTPPDTPLLASNPVQDEVEARLSIGFSAKGSIVSMPEQSLSLVAWKKQASPCSRISPPCQPQDSKILFAQAQFIQ